MKRRHYITTLAIGVTAGCLSSADSSDYEPERYELVSMSELPEQYIDSIDPEYSDEGYISIGFDYDLRAAREADGEWPDEYAVAGPNGETALILKWKGGQIAEKTQTYEFPPPGTSDHGALELMEGEYTWSILRDGDVLTQFTMELRKVDSED